MANPNRKKRSPAQNLEIPIEPKPIKTVKPANAEQARLMQVIINNDIIFLKGIAGGGKTYVSAGLGAEYLMRGVVDKIIISRPIISAEKDFGILPGSLDEKIEPYLGPVVQELSYFINVKKFVAEEKIVVIPVAFMRGLTFKNSFVIIDEAENLTYNQIKLILTRIGDNTKIILNGDVTQSDLDYRHYKDFDSVIDKMSYLCGPENRIAIFEMLNSVRDPRIKKILAALERDSSGV